MNEKRFYIKESVFAEEKEVILDNENQYTFPPLCIGDNYMFRKALNEQHEEIQELTDAVNQRTKQLDVQYETVQMLKKEIERLKGRYYD